MKRLILILTLLLLVILPLAACGETETTTTDGTGNTTTAATTTQSADIPTPDTEETTTMDNVNETTKPEETTAQDTTVSEITTEAPVTTTEAPETTTEAPATTTVPETTAPETTAAATTPEAPVTYTPANWMNAVPDNTLLSDIAIPGTHDSGATKEAYGISGTAKCQNLSIAEQLAIGVRFFDIRLARVNGALQVYHGDVDQKLTFDEVLTACYDFLAANPSEALIMLIKEERDPSGTNDAFDTMVKTKISENADKWYTGSTVPKLQSVRGKIVLMRRFSTSGTYGFNASGGWSDNTTFTISSGGTVLRCQDYYQNSSGAAKWTEVSAFFETMKSTPNTYYLNYTSGYVPGLFSIPSITKTSNHVIPLLREYLATSPDIVGVIVMDFVDAELASLTYELNFD